MKHVDAYRDPVLAKTLSAAIAEETTGRRYALMEFCGGHTHAICRYGLEDLLPPTVTMIHGPGCPVCVLPIGRLDMAIELALRPGVILATYGDMLRVPGSNGNSLLKAKAAGADIRMVYSTQAALDLTEKHPDRQVVFFAIGFETTTPPTAVALAHAKAKGLRNFTVFCNHVLTPPAIDAIMATDGTDGGIRIDGVVGPGHVSTVIGTGAYEEAADKHRRPIVISGFEPIDVLESVLRLVRQINRGEARVENGFSRAVRRDGNAKALALIDQVFGLRESFEWRGLGTIPHSALQLTDAYADFDAERRFGLVHRTVPDHKACECGDILRGVKRPSDCKVFGNACTPDNPLGSCMVSPEGACAAFYLYGRFRDVAATA